MCGITTTPVNDMVAGEYHQLLPDSVTSEYFPIGFAGLRILLG
jgi:hypothetical protein